MVKSVEQYEASVAEVIADLRETDGLTDEEERLVRRVAADVLRSASSIPEATR